MEQPCRKEQPQGAVMVMTRYPQKGRVKTRLIEALGTEGATRLHQRMAEHTLATLKPLADINLADLFVFFQGGDAARMQAWLGQRAIYKPQPEGDLGAKMAHAFNETFYAGYSSAIILGTDCPHLDGDTIAQAFNMLNYADTVLGPAEDGGYYLLGLSRPCPQLFQGIHWSSSQVLAQTVAQAKQQHMAIQYLPTLTDIDSPEDLDTLRGTFLLP